MWILGFVVVIWAALYIYVTANEQKFIRKIETAINSRTKGESEIKGLSVSLFRTFPIVSLQLEDVAIRDSLYPTHHQDLLIASDIYLKISLPALIRGEKAVGKVIIRNGALNIFVDSTGSGNSYLLEPREKSAKPEKPSVSPDIQVSNIKFTYTNLARRKLYQADLREVNCVIHDDPSKVVLRATLDMLVHHLEFDTKKGSFAKEKSIEGKLQLVFDKTKKELVANKINLDVDNHPYVFDGVFKIGKDKPKFNLTITTQQIRYADAAAVLNPYIEKKLKRYDIEKPIDVKVQLTDDAGYNSEPRVEAWVDVEHTDVKAPQGKFNDCSFKGYFSNEMAIGKPRVDSNSVIRFENLSSTWNDITFQSKLARIYNFDLPILECDLSSEVDFNTVNKIAGSNTLRFQKGVTKVAVNYKGPIDSDKMSIPDIDGQVKISNAEVKYLPRNFLFTNLEGLLIFKDHDLTVKKISAAIGSTKLEMSGYAKNLLSLLITSPEKLETRWQIQSPLINLDDFTTFLTKSTEEKKKTERAAQFGKAASNVDKMMQEGEVFMTLISPAVTYKNFRGTDLQANVVLKKGMLELQKASMKHANGSMEVSGSLTNGPGVNPVKLRTRMSHINIPKLFKAFDNFGQDAITHENLSGTLSADIDLTSAVTDKAKMVTSSSKGTIEFLLEDGELNHFEPLLKVGEKVFKKQNFNEIRFADLKNKLDVTGTTFIVNPMEIRSTAMTVFVEGVYDVKKGSDMSIQLPLNNLTKSQANTDLNTGVKKKKGVSLRLRAKTDEDGKLKLSWDPFKRAIRNKEEVQDSKRQ